MVTLSLNTIVIVIVPTLVCMYVCGYFTDQVRVHEARPDRCLVSDTPLLPVLRMLDQGSCPPQPRPLLCVLLRMEGQAVQADNHGSRAWQANTSNDCKAENSTKRKINVTMEKEESSLSNEDFNPLRRCSAPGTPPPRKF